MLRPNLERILACYLALSAGIVSCATESESGGETSNVSTDTGTSDSASESTASTATVTDSSVSSSSLATSSSLSCESFVSQGSPLQKCQGSALKARCEHAASQSSLIYDWGFTLHQLVVGPHGESISLSTEEQIFRQSCLVAALQAAGANEVNGDPSSPWFVRATGTYASLENVLALETIASIEPRCRSDLDPQACPCGSLPPDSCGEHPFCFPVRAKPVEIDQRCLGEEKLIGCTRSGGCGPGAILAYSPEEGELWAIPTSCMPDQPGWSLCVQDSDESCDGLNWPSCGLSP
jgi:hypothetical protein